jgi:hypothetical protein
MIRISILEFPLLPRRAVTSSERAVRIGLEELADHLSAGGFGDAACAIEEEVARVPPCNQLSPGLTWGKF